MKGALKYDYQQWSQAEDTNYRVAWFRIVGISMCFKLQTEVLAPSTTECDLTWKQGFADEDRLRSEWIRMDHQPIRDTVMIEGFGNTQGSHRNTAMGRQGQKIETHFHSSRNIIDCQQSSEARRAGEGSFPSPRTSDGAWPCHCLDSELLAYRAVRKQSPFVSTHPGFGTLKMKL